MTSNVLMGFSGDINSKLVRIARQHSAAADLGSDKTAKADLQQALQVAIAYCSRAYAMTDEQLAQSVLERRVTVRMQPLVWNAGHNYEHYGNMVTYMRMNGLVPPSSERPEIEERLQGTQPRQ